MTARVLATTAAALAAFALPAASAQPRSGRPEAPQARAATSSVGVGEREYRISLYRRTVAPGRVHFNVKNFGEDVHTLAILSSHGKILRRTADIGAGDTATLSVSLPPGSYRLICTTSNHYALGMHARITVRRARR
jgi:plastocyanin